MRALVAAVLMVLGLATSASAECAWVLWMSTLSTPEKVFLAYGTQAACEEKREEMVRMSMDGFNSGKVKLENLPLGRCLPDTVDPRGPKGK